MNAARLAAIAVLCAALAPVVSADEPLVRARFVGDVAVAGTMRDEMLAHGLDPFAQLGDSIARADLAIANLESTLTTLRAPRIALDHPEMPILRSPPRTAALLARAGFDAVTMANNHALDFGPEGLRDSLAHVREAGLIPVGAGTTVEDARRMHVFHVRGLRIGLLSFTGMVNQHPVGEGYVARLAHAEERVRAARDQVDVLLVALHWGVEYEARPERWQRQLAHTLVDAGADAILGHHPHVLQTVETYRGAPIVYSLGNFVFGPQPAPRDVSAIAELEIRGHAVTGLRMIPVILRGTVGSPMVSTGAQGDRARARLSPGMSWLERGGVLEASLVAERVARR